MLPDVDIIFIYEAVFRYDRVVFTGINVSVTVNIVIIQVDDVIAVCHIFFGFEIVVAVSVMSAKAGVLAIRPVARIVAVKNRVFMVSPFGYHP